MTGTEARDGRRLRTLILAVHMAGLFCVAFSAGHLGGHVSPFAIGAVVVLAFVVEHTGFFVALGAAKMRLDWGEASIIVGLILLPAAWLVLVSAATMAVLGLLRHSKFKQGSFNVMSAAINTGAARAVATAFGQNLSRPAAWVGLALAAITFALTSAMAVFPAVAISTGQRIRVVLRCQLPPLMASTAAGSALTLLVVACWEWSR